MTRTTRLGLPVTEHTRSTLSPIVTNRLPCDVLLWGDEGVAARDLFCLRYNILVTIIYSDVFYGAVDSRRQKRRTRWNSRREARGRPRRNVVSMSAVFSSRRRHAGVELHHGVPDHGRAIRAHSFTAFAKNCMETRNIKSKANSAVGASLTKAGPTFFHQFLSFTSTEINLPYTRAGAKQLDRACPLPIANAAVYPIFRRTVVRIQTPRSLKVLLVRIVIPLL